MGADHRHQLSQDHGCCPPHPLTTDLEIRHLIAAVLVPPIAPAWTGRGPELGQRGLQNSPDFGSGRLPCRGAVSDTDDWMQREMAGRYVEW